MQHRTSRPPSSYSWRVIVLAYEHEPRTVSPDLTPHPSRFTALRVRLGVFAGKLRCLPFQPLFLALQPRLPCPRALEIVADLHAQAAERLGFQLNEIAILEGVQAAVVGSQ